MKRLAAVAVICVLGAALAAQVAQPQFRSRVDVVHLDVSVLDRDRRPVRGLTAADFTVLEDGKPQKVSVFVPVDIPDPVAPPVAWMKDVAPDVRSNADVKDRRLFLIAIDDATIAADAFALKKVREIARGVVDRLGPTDLAAVVFSRDNRQSQDFTSDRARLLAAIDAFTVGSYEMGDMPADRLIDDLWMLYGVTTVLRAVESFVELPDRRKTVVLISSGVPFSAESVASPISAHRNQAVHVQAQRNTQLQLRDRLTELFTKAQRANVNVYTADPCGLRDASSPISTPCRYSPTKLDYLVGMAAQTGGRPIVNTNDFDPGLNQIFIENGSYYLLAFESTKPARDGTLRRLEVKVDRPGVTVRTRSGYFAPKTGDPAEAMKAANPTDAALATALPTTALPMTVTAAAFRSADDPETATVAIVVGVRQPLGEDPARRVEPVDLRIGAYNTDGKSFGTTSLKADVRLRAGATGDAEYELLAKLPLKRGRYQLRIATTVGRPAASGSVYYDITVPDFAREMLTLSDVAIAASRGPAVAPLEGLAGVLPILPTVRRAFGVDARVTAFARACQGGSGAPLPANVRWRIRDASDAIVVDRAADLGQADFGSARAADLLLDVPIASLPPGEYLLTLEASIGEAMARRDVRFQVVK
jgi:VWFA-related protein